MEYGAIKFALFFMAEYIHIVIISLLLATLYFGGYELPYISSATLAEPDNAALLLKILVWPVIIGTGLAGWKLLNWHQVNRAHWRDSRKNEGLVLSLLLGFGPCLTALALFFGWDGELGTSSAALWTGLFGFLVLMLKTLFFCWLFVWVRWTTPRFRYDQLMGLGWKLLIPL